MHTKKFIAAVIGAFLLFGTNEASIINSDMKAATVSTKPTELQKPAIQTKPALLVDSKPQIQTKPALLVDSKPHVQTKPAVLPATIPVIQTQPLLVDPKPVVGVSTKPALLVDPKPVVGVSTKPALLVDPKPVTATIQPAVIDSSKLPQHTAKQGQKHANSNHLTGADNAHKEQKPSQTHKKKKPSTVDFDKKQWPQLKGLPASYAKLNISKTNPVLTIVIVKEGQPVTRDFNQNRVRIFIDAKQMVKEVPVRG